MSEIEVGLSVRSLVVQNARQIRRFIERRSGNAVLKRTTVDDLYQETIAVALASADRFTYSGNGTFLAWIYTIARRVIAHSYRKADARQIMVRIKGVASTGVGVGESRFPSRGNTPSSVVARMERHGRLWRGIRQLPMHYQEVLTLYKIEERPLIEVAARLNRTKGATCRLLARALAKLYENIEE